MPRKKEALHLFLTDFTFYSFRISGDLGMRPMVCARTLLDTYWLDLRVIEVGETG